MRTPAPSRTAGRRSPASSRRSATSACSRSFAGWSTRIRSSLRIGSFVPTPMAVPTNPAGRAAPLPRPRAGQHNEARGRPAQVHGGGGRRGEAEEPRRPRSACSQQGLDPSGIHQRASPTSNASMVGLRLELLGGVLGNAEWHIRDGWRPFSTASPPDLSAQRGDGHRICRRGEFAIVHVHRSRHFFARARRTRHAPVGSTRYVPPRHGATDVSLADLTLLRTLDCSRRHWASGGVGRHGCRPTRPRRGSVRGGWSNQHATLVHVEHRPFVLSEANRIGNWIRRDSVFLNRRAC